MGSCILHMHVVRTRYDSRYKIRLAQEISQHQLLCSKHVGLESIHDEYASFSPVRRPCGFDSADGGTGAVEFSKNSLAGYVYCDGSVFLLVCELSSKEFDVNGYRDSTSDNAQGTGRTCRSQV
jgi:hypothetical protein